MNKPLNPLARRYIWILPVLAIVLVAGHGVILYYVSSHVAMSATVVAGVVVLLVIKHLGLLVPLSALFRRRRSGHGP